jgi:aldose 1-epimerase
MVDDEKNILKLYYLSKDGEEGYPGNLKVIVSYSLTDENELIIEYGAVSDKDTVVNLTNHSYFNLRGHFTGDMLNQKLMINSDMFTINDRFSIPTGEIRKVENTPMDFRVLKRIGEEIDTSDEQIQFGSGYDHNWILNSKGDKNILAAKLVDEVSGRVMDIYTTNFGVQVYSGNFLDGSDLGKNNIHYIKRSGICLETQFVPNAINNSKFDTPILGKSDEYKHITIYKFSTL